MCFLNVLSTGANMKKLKLRHLSVAVGSALLLGFGANAMADSTKDIVNALVAKGVLTEEEGDLLSKGRNMEQEAQKKKEAFTKKIFQILNFNCNLVIRHFGERTLNYQKKLLQSKKIPLSDIN
jgi:polyhydroxyalkanoate synthesis regulator phasin